VGKIIALPDPVAGIRRVTRREGRGRKGMSGIEGRGAEGKERHGKEMED